MSRPSSITSRGNSVLSKSLIFIGIIALCASCVIYKTVPITTEYSKNVTFTVSKIIETHSIATGNGHYYPSRGYKFVILFATFVNKSSEKEDLNFGNIYLADANTQTRYKVEKTMVPGPVNIFGGIDSYIYGGDTKTRKLIFTYPEDTKAENLLVFDRVYPIEYTN